MLQAHPGIFAAFAILAGVVATALPADSQSVISTHSGVVHYFEGTVMLDDQPLLPHLGKYPSVPEGSVLRTADGRAEVLLTPGVFLRMNGQSEIRMISNDLSDTRVEVLAGSVIVESGETNSDTSVTLLYRGWGVHLIGQGTYRIDSDPGRLWVRQGEAEVLPENGSQTVKVEAGSSLPFGSAPVPDYSIAEPQDALRSWNTGRGDSISADNAITAQIDEDPAAVIPGADPMINFPIIGVPYPAIDPTGLYTSASLYQPGFNSVYLPGYTYRPMIITLVRRGIQTYPLRPGGLIGVSPGTITGFGTLRQLPVAPTSTLHPLMPPALAPRPAVVHAPPPRIGAGHR